jgi:hypothetical protein
MKVLLQQLLNLLQELLNLLQSSSENDTKKCVKNRFGRLEKILKKWADIFPKRSLGRKTEIISP